METPSSTTRRVTRSQALATANSANKIPLSKKIVESEKQAVTQSRQRTGKQSALIDITNDSPIVGLAMGNLETPSSEMSKKRTNGQAKHCITPGSGEALLRGQVKTLLQKVEEEAVLSKISLENRPFVHLKGIVKSPIGFLAPTPANTPLMDLSVNEFPAVTASPVDDKLVISKIMNEMFEEEKQGGLESEKSYITRSLLLDFSEKYEGSEESSVCSSVVTYQGGEAESKDNDDNSSMWSIQVNASTKDDEEDEEGGGPEEEEEEEEDEYDDDNYDENEEDGDLVDELCEAISKINMNAKFEGKHTRFVYNSEDEMEGVEEEDATAASPGVLHLKGLPTPKGKHLRFPEENAEH